VAFVHGKDSVFTVNSKDLSAYLTQADLSNSVDMAETSTMGSEAKSYISGLSDNTISIAGFYDSTGTSGPDAVLNALVGSDSSTTFEYGPEGGTSGKVKYSGSCFLTSYNVTAPIGDVVGFAADFQTTGAVTKGTYS
jgi:hypothetical protein